MNDRDFIYWLQGYFEITLQGPAMLPDPEKGFGSIKYPPLGYQQWCSIRHHARLAISERQSFTHLSSIVDQISGMVEVWEYYEPDRLDEVANKIVKILSEVLTKVTPGPNIINDINYFSCSSFDNVGNVCFQSAEDYFRKDIYANPTGAGIMTC